MADGRHIEPIYCPIDQKFGANKQNHAQTQGIDQKSKFRKLKMADGRHFENGFITISQPGIIQFQ